MRLWVQFPVSKSLFMALQGDSRSHWWPVLWPLGGARTHPSSWAWCPYRYP